MSKKKITPHKHSRPRWEAHAHEMRSNKQTDTQKWESCGLYNLLATNFVILSAVNVMCDVRHPLYYPYCVTLTVLYLYVVAVIIIVASSSLSSCVDLVFIEIFKIYKNNLVFSYLSSSARRCNTRKKNNKKNLNTKKKQSRCWALIDKTFRLPRDSSKKNSWSIAAISFQNFGLPGLSMFW